MGSDGTVSSSRTLLSALQAVCCADHVHCCPQGYTCDPSWGICQESSHVLPWAPKQSALTTQSHGIRCNATVSCEEGQTCCKGVSGDWRCCQLPNVSMTKVSCLRVQHRMPKHHTAQCRGYFWAAHEVATSGSLQYTTDHIFSHSSFSQTQMC